ncbi:hypothetical protein HDU76_005707, partial [Blyttiomyces sp. JEL0837]
YSAELGHVIRAMLNVNHMKRPSTGELLKVYKIRWCLKERDLVQMQAELKKREEEIKKREAALEAREAACVVKEEELVRREAEISALSSSVSVASGSVSGLTGAPVTAFDPNSPFSVGVGGGVSAAVTPDGFGRVPVVGGVAGSSNGSAAKDAANLRYLGGGGSGGNGNVNGRRPLGENRDGNMYPTADVPLQMKKVSPTLEPAIAVSPIEIAHGASLPVPVIPPTEGLVHHQQPHNVASQSVNAMHAATDSFAGLQNHHHQPQPHSWRQGHIPGASVGMGFGRGGGRPVSGIGGFERVGNNNPHGKIPTLSAAGGGAAPQAGQIQRLAREMGMMFINGGGGTGNAHGGAVGQGHHGGVSAAGHGHRTPVHAAVEVVRHSAAKSIPGSPALMQLSP